MIGGKKQRYILLALVLTVNVCFFFSSISSCGWDYLESARVQYTSPTIQHDVRTSATTTSSDASAFSFWSNVKHLSSSAGPVIVEHVEMKHPSTQLPFLFPHFNHSQLHRIPDLYTSPEMNALYIQHNSAPERKESKKKAPCRISFLAHFHDAVLASCFSITTRQGHFYAAQDFGHDCAMGCSGFCNPKYERIPSGTPILPPQHQFTDNVTVVRVPKLLVALFQWGTEFQHVLKDVLPRLVMAKPLLEQDAEVRVLLQYDPRVREMLDYWQFPLDRVLWADRGPARTLYGSRTQILYHAQHMYWPQCHPGPLWTSAFPPSLYQYHHVISSMSKTMTNTATTASPNNSNNHHHRPALIYVSRAGGKNSQTRTISNEAALVTRLRDLFSGESTSNTNSNNTIKKNIEVVSFVGGNQTLKENMALFARAIAIVGPHGGGFYNMVASPPGTLIVELVPDDYGRCEVRGLATKLGHIYVSAMKEDMLKTSSFGEAPLDWIMDILKRTLQAETERFLEETPLSALPPGWKMFGPRDCT